MRNLSNLATNSLLMWANDTAIRNTRNKYVNYPLNNKAFCSLFLEKRKISYLTNFSLKIQPLNSFIWTPKASVFISDVTLYMTEYSLFKINIKTKHYSISEKRREGLLNIEKCLLINQVMQKLTVFRIWYKSNKTILPQPCSK